MVLVLLVTKEPFSMSLDSFVDAVVKVFVNLQWYLQYTIALRISALGATGTLNYIC